MFKTTFLQNHERIHTKMAVFDRFFLPQNDYKKEKKLAHLLIWSTGPQEGFAWFFLVIFVSEKCSYWTCYGMCSGFFDLFSCPQSFGDIFEVFWNSGYGLAKSVVYDQLIIAELTRFIAQRLYITSQNMPTIARQELNLFVMQLLAT